MQPTDPIADPLAVRLENYNHRNLAFVAQKAISIAEKLILPVVFSYRGTELMVERTDSIFDVEARYKRASTVKPALYKNGIHQWEIDHQ